MVEGLLGRKVGMSQLFDERGACLPVTLIEVGPCVVLQGRSGKGGAAAVQLGLLKTGAAGRQNKPMSGHLKKHGGELDIGPIREFRLIGDQVPEAGTRLDVSLLEGVGRVDVRGISKGKGFQGVVRRHHFRGGRATHGSMFHRAPGSIGASSFPSRVMKGMRGAGRMGGTRVTSRNLKVVQLSAEHNLLAVCGAVPGPNGGFVEVRRSHGEG
ncbi:MAG TPA: 50S ribosomal protein L3 [Acidobacteriota bacterium]